MSSGVCTAGRGKAVSALLLLSFLWALDGLGPDLFPALRRAPLPLLERQAVTFALLAVAAAVFAGTRRVRWPGARSSALWASIGLLIFAAPPVLVFATQGRVPQLERVAIFTLTPVFAVALEPHIGNAQQRSDRALLAALISVAGGLCIFPLDIPGTPGGALAVLAVVIASVCVAAGNCVAIRLACLQPEVSIAAITALAAGAAAVALGLAGMPTEYAQWSLPLNGAQLAWFAAIDVPALVLLFRLLRRMAATKMTSRYLIAPLFTILAGIAIEQPAVTLRMVLGVVLLAFGAIWLLLEPDDASMAWQ